MYAIPSKSFLEVSLPRGAWGCVQTSKGQFHCMSCGICRIGGREKFFHCDRCGKHISPSRPLPHPSPLPAHPTPIPHPRRVLLLHFAARGACLCGDVDAPQLPRVPRGNPCAPPRSKGAGGRVTKSVGIVWQFIFDSIRDITVMPCGHPMHLGCMAEMRKHGQ